MRRSHSRVAGVSAIPLVLAIGGVSSIVVGMKYREHQTAMQQVEIERSRAEIQRKIASGMNLIQGLIAGKHILPTGDAKLIRVVENPADAGTGACAGVVSNTAHDAGLWKYTPGSAGVNPRIDLNLCHRAAGQPGCIHGEAMRLEFTARDAGQSTADMDMINGRFIYTGPSSGRASNATYDVKMEISRGDTPSIPGGKCAIFIATRGSHWTNNTASARGGFPNWGNAWPHYNWWQMFIPHPPDLVAAATWQGAPGTSRFNSILASGPIATGNFAPCNRMYPFLWWCTAWYSPVPLVRNHCGQPVLSFTNHTPGSGTCSTDCRCYLGVQVSPLVIDFAGNGVKFSTGLRDQVKFDMGSGPDLRTPWVRNGAEVGFLALDVNQNGVIDNTHELFGDKTILPDGKERDNGFLALGYYDANGDRLISAEDPVFARLLVWNDVNADGKTDPFELRKATDAGLVAFDLNARDEESNSDGSGNRALFSSSVTTSDGKVLDVHDVYFGGNAPQSRKGEEKLVSIVDAKAIVFND